jgi:O-antigen/teichoic acid export membrane protein
MSLLRFLPGIILLQISTAALVYALMFPGAHDALWIPVAVLGAVVCLLSAFWFGSIADHVKKNALANVRTQHALEREKIVVTAEIDKRAALEQSHQRILKETARAQSQAYWRLGLGLIGLLALGGIMVAIEFMTVGLLIMATAGGALGGYVIRSRHDARFPGRSIGQPPLLTAGEIKAFKAGPANKAPSEK